MWHLTYCVNNLENIRSYPQLVLSHNFSAWTWSGEASVVPPNREGGLRSPPFGPEGVSASLVPPLKNKERVLTSQGFEQSEIHTSEPASGLLRILLKWKLLLLLLLLVLLLFFPYDISLSGPSTWFSVCPGSVSHFNLHDCYSGPAWKVPTSPCLLFVNTRRWARPDPREGL